MSDNPATEFTATLADSQGRKNLIGLDRGELLAEMLAMGEKPFRAKQLWHWIYHRCETDFAMMTTLANRRARHWPNATG